MKTLIQLLFFAILVSCNSNVESDKALTVEKASNDNPTASEKIEKAKNTEQNSKINLKQNGDYTSLFYAGDCSKVVNAATVAEIVRTEVKVSPSARICRFVYAQYGVEIYMTVSINDMSNYNIEKEIENSMTNPPFLAHEISKTGDSHICRQDSHKRLIIYNTNYDHSVAISYGVNGEGTITKEQKTGLKDQAVDLANLLLKNNQK